MEGMKPNLIKFWRDRANHLVIVDMSNKQRRKTIRGKKRINDFLIRYGLAYEDLQTKIMDKDLNGLFYTKRQEKKYNQ